MLLQCKLHFDLAFQSTLPRGERLESHTHNDSPSLISIHAPARGATIFDTINATSILISIHAPARGATADGTDPDHVPVDFNPRSREGSDQPKRRRGFYFRQFQSTLPRGERRLRAGCLIFRKNFNPRSREGSDGETP